MSVEWLECRVAQVPSASNALMVELPECWVVRLTQTAKWFEWPEWSERVDSENSWAPRVPSIQGSSLSAESRLSSPRVTKSRSRVPKRQELRPRCWNRGQEAKCREVKSQDREVDGLSTKWPECSDAWVDWIPSLRGENSIQSAQFSSVESRTLSVILVYCLARLLTRIFVPLLSIGNLHARLSIGNWLGTTEAYVKYNLLKTDSSSTWCFEVMLDVYLLLYNGSIMITTKHQLLMAELVSKHYHGKELSHKLHSRELENMGDQRLDGELNVFFFSCLPSAQVGAPFYRLWYLATLNVVD